MISIIVPIYNKEKYLNKCLDSIVNQTYKDLEIILVDDGSTDNSPAICDEYQKNDERIIVIHKPNGGLSSARNTGLNNAHGDYITFIDSDDYIELDTFEAVVKAINDTVDVVLIREKMVDLDGNIIRIEGNTPTNKLYYKDQKFLADLIIKKQLTGCCDKIFKKEILESIKFEENRHHGEDLLFNVEALRNIKTVAYVDSIKYSYVSNMDSITHSSFNSHSTDNIYFKDKVESIVKECFPEYYLVSARRCFVARQTILRLLYDGKLIKKEHALYTDIMNYMKDKYKLVKKNLSKKEKIEYLIYTKFRILYPAFLSAAKRKK